MKKIISIILLITLTLALSGCDRETVMPNVDDTRHYTQEEVDEIRDELEESYKLIMSDEIPCVEISEGVKECEQFVKLGDIYYITTTLDYSIKNMLSYVLSLEQRIVEQEEYNVWLENALDDYAEEVNDRIELLEDEETYTKDQMSLVFDIYHIQVGILEIEKIMEERILLPEESLVLAGLRYMLNQAERQLENGDE